MTEREELIIQAAFRVFLRYGIKRTSMNDIAQEAGIARQTLYNAFPNKDEVVRAGISYTAAQSIAQINRAVDDGKSLSDIVDAYVLKMTIEPFELLHTNPNAEDIVDGINTVSKEALDQTIRDFVGVAKKFLTPYEMAFAKSGKSVDEIAEFLQVSAYGAKKIARDRQHLDIVLSVIKTATLQLAGLGPDLAP